jgi:hypothetical protein
MEYVWLTTVLALILSVGLYAWHLDRKKAREKAWEIAKQLYKEESEKCETIEEKSMLLCALISAGIQIKERI